jgi:hypothetical protein
MDKKQNNTCNINKYLVAEIGREKKKRCSRIR